ncbi:hypothetical protein GCM10022247_56040 [Allokutzneria multivorans]|uniref:Uncharacterized protein n=1 Tax=Allokutzneria multivorans TaxID=1142134 RepID=A0ABP7TCI0_9PSEU
MCSRIDPFGARLPRYAQRISPGGQAVVWRNTVHLTGEGSHVLAILNLSVVLQRDIV